MWWLTMAERIRACTHTLETRAPDRRFEYALRCVDLVYRWARFNRAVTSPWMPRKGGNQ